jgi:hypothetical protein
MEPTRADITRQPAFGAAFSFYGDSGDSCIYLSISIYCAHTAGSSNERIHAMNRWDERPDAFHRARLELIKTLHRKSLVERAGAPKSRPPLPDAIDAAWDMPPRSRVAFF